MRLARWEPALFPHLWGSRSLSVSRGTAQGTGPGTLRGAGKTIPGTILLSVGRLVPWKGFRLLIKLMPQFLEINPFFRLIIVGSGPDREYLLSMIRHMNLQ